MNFSVFSDEEIKKVIDHSLEVQSNESIEAIVKKFGSIEEYRAVVSENLKDEERMVELIKIYGSKDKAIEASLSSKGSMDELKQVQDEIDCIYRQFAHAMAEGDSDMAMEAVEKLAASYKKLLRVDNARYVLLKVADDYLNNNMLLEATDKQYGDGIARYIAEAVKKYYGM